LVANGKTVRQLKLENVMKGKKNSKQDLTDLTQQGAVCVVARNDSGIGVMVYDRDNRSPQGTQIRTHRPGEVDPRWDGPLFSTAAAVLDHVARTDEPCSVPVGLAQTLLTLEFPFAELSEE